MKEKKLRNHLFKSTLILLIFVFSLTSFMNVNSFEQKYADSLISTKVISGKEFINKTESSIKYGKSIGNFYGMNTSLANWLKEEDNISSARILTKDNKIMYQAYSKEVSSLPKDLSKINIFTKEDVYKFKVSEGFYHIFLPIRDSNSNWIATFEFSFEKATITPIVKSFVQDYIFILICFFIISILALKLYTSKGNFLNKNNEIKMVRLIISLLIIIGSVQIFTCWINYNLYNEAYKIIAKENTYNSSLSLKKDIEKVIDKGITYRNLHGLESYMDQVVHIVPEVESITLISGGTIYRSGLDEKENEFLLSIPLSRDYEGTQGSLEIVISESFIRSALKSTFLDVFTIFVTSFLFLIEFIFFLVLYMNKKFDSKKTTDSKISTLNLRVLMFIVYTASYMSVSFVPQYMKTLVSKPILGLSTNLLLTLPVSISFFTGAIFTFIGGKLIDKVGYRKILNIGIINLFISFILSALVKDPIIFIFSRGLFGIGYSLTYISVRSYVANANDETIKQNGFSSITSGIYAGINIGAAIGALLMEKVGYKNVFFASALFLLLSYIVIIEFFEKRTLISSKNILPIPQKKSSMISFLWNIDVLCFFLLISIPMAISSLFLDYFLPVYASDAGVSTSSIGRAYLLNGICIAYVGPLMIKFLKSRFNTTNIIFMSMVFVGISFMTFGFLGTFGALYITSILLGIGEGFGLPSHTQYYLNLRATKTIGKGEALGYYSNIRKIAQTIGPQLFAFSITLGYKQGIMYMSLCILILCFMFICLNFFKTYRRPIYVKTKCN